MHQISSALIKAKQKIKKYPTIKNALISLGTPLVTILGYFYGAYLTIRYVDDYDNFPAIKFRGALIKLKIKKGLQSKLVIKKGLLVHPLGVSRTPSFICLGDSSSINILNEFVIGDDVQLTVYRGGVIQISGKQVESVSGISGRSHIQSYKKLTIGSDALIASGVYITDSDWHQIDGGLLHKETNIGDHVWIGMDAKILKGSNIGDNSIIGAGAVVTGGVYVDRTLIGGVPAKVIKNNIASWHRDMQDNV